MAYARDEQKAGGPIGSGANGMIPLRRGDLKGSVVVWRESRSDGHHLLVRVSLHGETDTFHLPFSDVMEVETEGFPMGGLHVKQCHEELEAIQGKLSPALEKLMEVDKKIELHEAKLEKVKGQIKKLKGVGFLRLCKKFAGELEEILKS
jgi:hypothetical protein